MLCVQYKSFTIVYAQNFSPMCTQFPAPCSPRSPLVGDLPADHRSTPRAQAAREYPQLSTLPAQHDTLTQPPGRAHSQSTALGTDLADDQSSQHQSAVRERRKMHTLWTYACMIVQAYLYITGVHVMHIDSQCSWCIRPVVLQSFVQKPMKEELPGQPMRKKPSRLPYPVK